MNLNKGISTPLVIGIIAVIVLGGGGVAYYYTTKVQPSPVACTQEAKICPDGSAVSRTGPNCEFAQCPVIAEDNYSFSVVENQDPEKQYPDESIAIYKNQQLVKTIFIKDTYVKPTLFSLSPDQKYVAFRVAIYGGTCVLKASPMVVDLDSFSIVNLDNSGIEEELRGVFGDNISKLLYTTEIKSISWSSNDKIVATMQFGDNICSIEGNPPGTPNTLSADIEFTLNK